MPLVHTHPEPRARYRRQKSTPPPHPLPFPLPSPSTCSLPCFLSPRSIPRSLASSRTGCSLPLFPSGFPPRPSPTHASLALVFSLPPSLPPGPGALGRDSMPAFLFLNAGTQVSTHQCWAGQTRSTRASESSRLRLPPDHVVRHPFHNSPHSVPCGTSLATRTSTASPHPRSQPSGGWRGAEGRGPALAGSVSETQ
jgi:hypothetical protein